MSELAEAVALVQSRARIRPEVGIILGSGLGPVADQIEPSAVVGYGEIPGFPGAGVPGHEGELVLGTLEGRGVAALKGRVHLYEGYTPAEVGLPVRFLHGLGVSVLVVTNAAGGLRPGMRPGTLMLIEDHINLPGLAGLNPLVGTGGGASRFVDMVDAYDPRLREVALEEAAANGLNVDAGVYVMVAGPSYETPAEARMLRGLGADAVGMSTVPEVVIARALGLRVLGISCITNVLLDPGIAHEAEHSEVISVAAAAATRMAALVRGVLRRLED